MLLLDVELSDERQNEILARARDLVEKDGGVWVGQDSWGRRKLAYEIDKRPEAVYYLLHFDCEPATLDELTRILKITDGAMRHMATRRLPSAARIAPPPAPASGPESAPATPSEPAPASEPESAPATPPEPAPEAEAAPEPAPEPAAEPAPEREPEAAEPAPEPAAEPATEREPEASEPAPEAAVEPAPEPVEATE